MRKGQRKHQKRISVGKAFNVLRKESTWIIKQETGAHSKQNSITLGIALRDLLKIASNMKEIKALLNKGEVTVNGIKRKEPGFTIGLFDLIKIKNIESAYRVLIDSKSRIYLKQIDFKEKEFKVSRIKVKKIIKTGITQVTTEDGFNFKVKETKLKVNDSVKIDFPEIKISEELPLKENSIVLIVKGTHVGQIAKIKEITAGNQKRSSLILLEHKKESFQTTIDNIVVIGIAKPLIEVDLQ